jgi:hypothetical protein
VKELTFWDRRYLKQLLKGNKKEVLKPQNQMTKEECKMAFPKSKWFQPQESPITKAEIPENLLQDYANQAITLRGWNYIRFHTALLGWIKNSPTVPQWVRKCFFSQVAGKLPDNLIMVQVAPGMFLAVKMELKTQDSKGRAIGKTRGKQKHYAESEEWYICRSPDKINEALEKISKSSEMVKKALSGYRPPIDVSLNSISKEFETQYHETANKIYIPDNIPTIIHQLIDTRMALQAGYIEVALNNINEILKENEI